MGSRGLRLPVVDEGTDLAKAYSEALEVLTIQQRSFVEHLLADPGLHAGSAYKIAFPDCTEKAVPAATSRLMAKPPVLTALALAMALRAKKTGITAARVLKALWRNHRTAIKGLPIVSKETGEIVGHRPDLRASNEALIAVGKHVGMFTDRVDVTSKGEQLKTDRPSQIMVFAGKEITFE